MNGLVMIATTLIELAIAPFAYMQNRRRAAAAKPRYTGQRNRWQAGAR